MRWPFTAISICALLPTLPSQIQQEWVPLSTFPELLTAISYPPARARLFARSDLLGVMQLELSNTGTVRRLSREATPYWGERAAVYDPVRHVIVSIESQFFGPSIAYASISTFDGLTWTTPPGSIDAFPALAFDPTSGNVLAVGGLTFYGWPVGTARTISSSGVTTVATLPVARVSAALAQSPNGGMVLFGGDSVSTDTWLFSNNSWAQVAVTGPPGRSKHTMLFDPQSNRTYLYGGIGAGGALLGDFWAWNGSSWSQAPTPLVPPLSSPSLVLDNGVIVLLGNTSTPSTLAFHRLEFAGGTWNALQAVIAPTLRGWPARAFDAARGEIVKFGGQINPALLTGPLDDTWIWNGEWTLRQPATHPSGRQEAAMAFDAARGNCVLFGGRGVALPFYYDDTWTWDGVNWTQRTYPAGPVARRQHAMAYDPVRQVVVLFGGLEHLAGIPAEVWRSDTWEWNGQTWTQVANMPSVVSSPAMAYDEARGLMVLRTEDPQTSQAFTYELHTGFWILVAVGQGDGLMAYDPVEAAVIAIDTGGRWKLVTGGWVPLPQLTGLDVNIFTADNGLLPDPLRHGLIAASQSVSLATAAPANVTFLGTGCGGPPAPILTCNTRPALGAALRAEIDCGTSSGAFFAIGLAQASVSIGGGCTVRVDSIAVIAPIAAGTGGWAMIDLPVPLASSLVGLQLFAQAATTNPTLSLTNGLGFRVGL